jgi:hypothetical protein
MVSILCPRDPHPQVRVGLGRQIVQKEPEANRVRTERAFRSS